MSTNYKNANIILRLLKPIQLLNGWIPSIEITLKTRHLLSTLTYKRPQTRCIIKDYKMWLFYAAVVILSTWNGDSSCYSESGSQQLLNVRVLYKMQIYYHFLSLSKEIQHIKYESWGSWNISCELWSYNDRPDSKVHGANMGPTWVLSAPDGHHDGPTNLAIRAVCHGRLSPDMISHIDVSRKRPQKVTHVPLTSIDRSMVVLVLI